MYVAGVSALLRRHRQNVAALKSSRDCGSVYAFWWHRRALRLGRFRGAQRAGATTEPDFTSNAQADTAAIDHAERYNGWADMLDELDASEADKAWADAVQESQSECHSQPEWRSTSAHSRWRRGRDHRRAEGRSGADAGSAA